MAEGAPGRGPAVTGTGRPWGSARCRLHEDLSLLRDCRRLHEDLSLLRDCRRLAERLEGAAG
ncbi:hypothetical protein [Streptomyces sp. NPDC003487]